jgi:hypothetical protein
MPDITISTSLPASETVTYSISTPAARGATYRLDKVDARRKPSKDVEKAVYGYLRAIRALGRTDLNVSDVAAALNIAVPLVIAALGALRSKGVKFG